MHLFETLQQMKDAAAQNGTCLLPKEVIAEAETALSDKQHFIDLDIYHGSFQAGPYLLVRIYLRRKAHSGIGQNP